MADKKAEAQRIAGRVAELNEQIEVVAEEYNAAQLELETIQADIAAARAKVEQTKVEAEARRLQLQNYAVRAYLDGGSTGSLPIVLGSADGNDAGRRKGYLAAAVGDRQTLIDQLASAEEDSASPWPSSTAPRRRPPR